ncbi:DUF1599 domain-containing protein [Chitinophagaceae bacterium LB-8]|uniref:DUF1599 domain-containing protein n=1 Tax=Paraflavisolibacter caeni TaxID=2982496 RepID=A0A9X3BHK5_9BACT|nr:nucleotide modification associated domain-containing protein [Paraflavisolibacter caeni]MCU7549817.1 DUF1599 domain-containing protein [Paraflavisolibacter caeni]
MENYHTLDEQHLKSITEEVIQVLLKKNEDYGGASFDLGLNGNMVHLWDKVKRYKTLIEKKLCQGEAPNFESIQDTLRDIIGYALIGLVILDSENGK